MKEDMKSKKLSMLVGLVLHIAVVAMDNPSLPENQLQILWWHKGNSELCQLYRGVGFGLTKDLEPKIVSTILGDNQWWYCKEIFDTGTPTHAVKWNHNDTCLAIASSGHKAKIFDIETKKELACFNHDSIVTSVSWNHDDTCLVTGSHSGKVQIFDVKRKKELACFGHPDYVLSVDWSNDGACLVTGSFDHKMRIFDIKTKKGLVCFNLNNYVNSVSWNHDDTCLAIGLGDHTARIFDIKEREELACFNHETSVGSISWNNNSTCVATASGDSEVQIFNVKSKKRLAYFYHRFGVKSVSWNHGSTSLATGSYDTKVRIFEWHKNITIEQLLLKHALLKWLQLEKPNKNIVVGDISTVLEILFKDVAHKCELDYQHECIDVWLTFPQEMQKALFETMQYRITKYGK